MIVVPASVKVHLALGHTDMRKGLDGLATLIQKHLKKDPFSGHLFVFRGKNASRLKILFRDGTGAVPVHQAHGSWKFLVAARGGAWRLGDADAGAARDADRGHRLARRNASGSETPLRTHVNTESSSSTIAPVPRSMMRCVACTGPAPVRRWIARSWGEQIAFAHGAPTIPKREFRHLQQENRIASSLKELGQIVACQQQSPAFWMFRANCGAAARGRGRSAPMPH